MNSRVIEIIFGQSIPGNPHKKIVRIFVMDKDLDTGLATESTVIESLTLTKAYISKSALTDEETKAVALHLKCSRVLDVVAAPEFPI